MPVFRSTRRLFAAAGLIAGGVTLWQTDPAWAREAGLDVWNVGRLEAQLRACDADRDRLDAWGHRQESLFAANRAIVSDVARGRRSLAEAAETMWQMNRGDPGYVAALDTFYRGPTRTAQAANNLVQRVRHAPLPPAERDAAVARLTAEYVRTFGVPLNDE